MLGFEGCIQVCGAEDFLSRKQQVEEDGCREGTSEF